MVPQRLFGVANWHEILACGSLVLVAGCSAGPAGSAPRVASTLIGGESPYRAAPAEVGQGTHVVVARGTKLYGNLQRTDHLLSLSSKENVLFGLGQVVGDAVEIRTVEHHDGACQNAADGLWGLELSFWVSASDLVDVLGETRELGDFGGWLVTAHPGAELTAEGVVYGNFLAPLQGAKVSKAFSLREPTGDFQSWGADEVKTPFPVGERWSYTNQSGTRTTTVSVQHAEVTGSEVRIEEGCLTLTHILAPDGSADDQRLLGALVGGGGLGVLGGLKADNSVQLKAGAAVRWRDGRVAGRLREDLTFYDTWREGAYVCTTRKLPADGNLSADELVFCVEN